MLLKRAKEDQTGYIRPLDMEDVLDARALYGPQPIGFALELAPGFEADLPPGWEVEHLGEGAGEAFAGP